MKRIWLTLTLMAASSGLLGLLLLYVEYCAYHPLALLALLPLALGLPCYGLAGALLRKDAEEAP